MNSFFLFVIFVLGVWTPESMGINRGTKGQHSQGSPVAYPKTPINANMVNSILRSYPQGCRNAFIADKRATMTAPIEEWFTWANSHTSVTNYAFYIMGEPHFKPKKKDKTDIFINNQIKQKYTLNPAYYPQLLTTLAPIIRKHPKGVIVVSGLGQTHLHLQESLQKKFKKTTFEVYHYLNSDQRNKEILDHSMTYDSHYIITTEWTQCIALRPHLSAYINLDPNYSIQKVLEESQHLFSSSPDKTAVSVFMLTHYVKDRVKAVDLLNVMSLMKEKAWDLDSQSEEASGQELASLRVHQNSALWESVTRFLQAGYEKKQDWPFSSGKKKMGKKIGQEIEEAQTQ